MKTFFAAAALGAGLLFASAASSDDLRATGDLGLIIERATGTALIVESTDRTVLAQVEGLGNLSHASVVYSRDERYAYVFGRDGGLSKVDMLTGKLVGRVMQAGNSIGGAISDDGKLIAVANYKPGGVNVFDAETLELVSEVPAIYDEEGNQSKTIGLVDLPGRRFAFSLWDGEQTWILDYSKGLKPEVTKLTDIGVFPYDALVTGDGRHYIVGLFGEDGLAHVDLWKEPLKVERIMDGYGKGEEPLPVYKMPHLEGWAKANGMFALPAIGRHEVLFMDEREFTEVDRVAVHGQPVFAMARPDGRQIWVNFAPPHNDTIQVIDIMDRKIIKTLKPGPGVLHMEFTPRGEEVWMSVRDKNEIHVYDTTDFSLKEVLPAEKPSGIFFTSRAHQLGL
ncbi:cytochrome D1 domain-containing protein [Pseudovibrio denitrificans]|uniref:cytochrome D1 domain-containing protein n=1 Tax=Pseudovibrio denitrificans TaxID=258256 RepID=UPI0039BED63D